MNFGSLSTKARSMTTDPPPSDFEDVRIENWQTSLPSAICTNKEIFDEIFSWETWKTVLNPDQRDRIMKMLPPEVMKIPGEAEKTLEDLFSKSLTNFGSNPLDIVFDNLENGHYDPEVVETKARIVKEWRRESRRLMKHYHTKLLQDIVISREQHLRKLVPVSPSHKRNGKNSTVTTPSSVILSNPACKKNGKTESSKANGAPPSKPKRNPPATKSDKGLKPLNTGNGTNRNGKPVPALPPVTESTNKGKRGRLESTLSTTLSNKDGASSSDGPAKKKSKVSPPTKSKATTANKKSKDPPSQPLKSPSSSSQPMSSTSTSLLLGTTGASLISSVQPGTSLLLGTLTAGSSPSEPPTLSLRSPTSSQSSLLGSASLLESLISSSNSSSSLQVSTNHENSPALQKQLPKLFPSPSLASSSSQSFLSSPVQSSPILASQLQAPSPISVNLSTLTGAGLCSSRSDSITDSPSSSSITLNYTQTHTPPPTTPTSTTHMKGLMGEDSSSDEFEFESIEPTIGFSGPSNFSSKTSASIKTLTSSSASAAVSALATPDYKKISVTTQELRNIQKCSLLTNCLTQPLAANSSSNAAVSAALANNILTSTPVPVSTAIMAIESSNASSTIHHRFNPDAQQLQGQLQSQHKIIVTSGGPSTQQQQQLSKFLSLSSQQASATKLLTPQQLSNTFQQQRSNVICAAANNSIPATSSQTQVNAQAFVSSITTPSKEILATYGASIPSVETSMSISQNQSQQQHSSTTTNVLPIAVNIQQSPSCVSTLVQQHHQIKQTLVRAPASSHQTVTLLQSAPTPVIQQSHHHHHQMLSTAGAMNNHHENLMLGGGDGLTGSSLNTQSLQLPPNILQSNSNNGLSLGKRNSLSIPSISASTSPSITNLLDSDDLGLNLGSFSLGGLGLDMGVSLPELESSGMGGVVGSVDQIKLELDCGMDKIDDLSGVLDGNPFDSIPNLSDDLDGLDLDMVDGLCDFVGVLSEEKQYASFFSLIRDVLCSTRDHRMTLVCLEKTVRKWSISPGASLNPWYMRARDWNNALIIALNFLAGNYNDVHPEDFVPYIEYKYKTKYYQWIGAGRDGDNNLTPLCVLWMDNLDRLPPLKKSDGDGDEQEEEEDENEDSDSPGGQGDTTDTKKKTKRPQTPPPPRCTTDWTVRTSTIQEKDEFRAQEKCRFENPHKAFTYRMHGYESVVGPVKGVYSSQTGVTNKARGHLLLVDDRPPFVTILALVRDAVARLPNGEGTRSEICEMLRDSAFLAPDASPVTLNSVVSGALDRLHYERDPCVRYDSHKKSWIYLHRDRTQEQFERLHHNRSYLKSTKSRNNCTRKNRKSKSSSSSSSAPATPAPTTVITVNTSASQSSTSSQSSSTETLVNPVTVTVSTNDTTIGSLASVATATTSVASLVTLPPVSTINPKIQVSVTPSTTGTTQDMKPVVGVTTVSASPSAQVQQQALAGAVQLQPQTTAISNRGLITFPTNSVALTDAALQQQQSSINEILAAATGLRFQTPAGVGSQNASIVLNQNAIGAQQTKIHQQTYIQDPNVAAAGVVGQSTRLVLQQSQVLQQSNSAIQQQQTVLVQQQQQHTAAGAASALAPGQLLLNSPAAILKLPGNIRLGEGLKLANLRLPTAANPVGGIPLATAAANPLRMSPPRILLTRGGLTGQHTQGVLLGQTSTGQTVILSAGPSGTGTTHAVLQQALSSGNNPSFVTGNTNQLTLHAALSQAQTPVNTTLVSSSPTTTPAQTSVAQPSAHSQQIQPQVQSSQLIGSPAVQTFGNSKVPLKFGIITNVPNNSNTIVVSTAGTPTSGPPSIRGSFPSTSSGVCPTSSTSTLPPTSIALPASILAPTQSQSFPVTPSTTATQSSSNIITASTAAQTSQQQIIITTKNGGALSASQAQVQQIASVQGTTTGMSIGSGGSLQLQGLTTQTQQSPTLQQSFILQQQQCSQQVQSLALGQGQGQHQLTAPIIIRSAQGEFVSFGIPSNLSLGRGVQGIKVIPVQGNKTVFARVVGPTTSTGNVAQPPTTSSILLASGNLPSTSSAIAVSTSLGVTSALSGTASTTVPSSLALTASTSSAQVITLSSSANSQLTQQLPVVVQSQAPQQTCGTNLVDASSKVSNSGLGTLTLSAEVTTSSPSPSNSVVTSSLVSRSPNITNAPTPPSSVSN